LNPESSHPNAPPAIPAPAVADGDLAPPPRPLSPRVYRRSWSEPRVRSLWLAALAALLVATYLLASRYWLWRQDARLVRDGLPVQAAVRQTATEPVKGKSQPANSIVTLDYTVDGRAYVAEGVLRGRTEAIVVGNLVPIRVDPANPSRWTGATTVLQLGPRLVPGLIVLPVVLVFALASLVARARFLRLWRDGQAIEALVLESRQTALAPRARAVRCTPADPDDRRVIDVYVPPALAWLAKGDALRVLAPPGHTAPAVAVAWFENGLR
jgi:hypothetical protein